MNFNYSSFVVFLLFLFSISNSEKTQCNYRQNPWKQYTISNTKNIDSININIAKLTSSNSTVITQALSSNQNLRIYLHYSSSFNSLPDVDFYKQSIIKPAIDHLQNAIYPRNPSTTPILVDRDCVNGKAEYINSDRNRKACNDGCSNQTLCVDAAVPDLFLKACLKPDGSSVPNQNAGAGIANYDLVVLTTAARCSGSTLASATSCFQEIQLDRPVFGVMTICTEKYHPRFNVAMNINTIKHELLHVLGFAPERFAYFRDVDGNPLTPRDSVGQPNQGFNTAGSYYNFPQTVAKTVTRNRKSAKVASYSKTVLTLTLPNILNEARSHFNCPSLDGVDLEDSDYSSTKINPHFDKLFVGHELMSPNSDEGESQLSRLTLAFLVDTGWYTVNYAQAQNYLYGKNLGCDFLLNGCFSTIFSSAAISNPFCSDIPIGYKLKCSKDRRFSYTCGNSYQKNLDPKYSYFTKLEDLPSGETADLYGGLDINNEHCPVNEKKTFQLFTSDCGTENNNLRNDSDFQLWPEYYGSNSKCFDTTIAGWTSNNLRPGLYGARCFKYNCDNSTKTLTVYNHQQIICQQTTQAEVKSFSNGTLVATILCPNYASVCEIQNSGDEQIQILMNLICILQIIIIFVQ